MEGHCGMDSITPDVAAKLADNMGFIGLVAFFVLALIKGWIVLAGQYTEILGDRDFWRNRSLAQDEQITKLTEAVSGKSATDETVIALLTSIEERAGETQ